MEQQQQHPTPATYLKVFIALMVLLVITTGTAASGAFRLPC
jgi:hypothetical protein